MRMIATLFLAASLSITSAFAQDDKAKTGPLTTEPTSFKEAYTSYNKAVEDRDNRKRPSKRYEVVNFNHRVTYYAQKAYELGVDKYGSEHINSVNLALNWLDAYSKHSDKHDYPVKTLNGDIGGLEKAITANPTGLIDFYMAYNSFLITQSSKRGKSKSLRYFDKAIKVARDLEPENEVVLALTALQVGKILYANYNIPKTTKYLQNAQKILSRYPEKHKKELAMANFWLAKSYVSTKKYAPSAKHMSAALETLDKVAPTGHYTLSAHAHMVQILEKQGLSDEATAHCQLIGKMQPIDINRDQIPLYQFSPKYPNTYKEGWVTIEFTVDDQGFVKDPKPLEGENMKNFSESAITAVKDYRFAPRFADGQPVSTEGLRYRFVFRMNKR